MLGMIFVLYVTGDNRFNICLYAKVDINIVSGRMKF